MIQVVDSRQKMLSNDQIIEIAGANANQGLPMNRIKDMIRVEMAMPNTWKMRHGNTIFLGHKTMTPGAGFFRALNADTDQNYIQNVRVFMQAAYYSGFDLMVTQFRDPSVLNVFRSALNGAPPEMGCAIQKTNGGYQVTLKLGQKRTGAPE